MDELNIQEQYVEEEKPKRYVGSVILIILSLPIILLNSMFNVAKNYPFPMDAEKIGRHIGGVVSPFLLSAIITQIFFFIKKSIFKSKNNAFIKPFAIILFVTTLLSFISIVLNILSSKAVH